MIKCIHGVDLKLDKGKVCTDCEVYANASGMPGEARQVDPAAFARAMWEDNPALRAQPTTAGIESAFIDARRAAAEAQADIWAVERRAQIWQAIAAHQADILALQGELLEIATQ